MLTIRAQRQTTKGAFFYFLFTLQDTVYLITEREVIISSLWKSYWVDSVPPGMGLASDEVGTSAGVREVTPGAVALPLSSHSLRLSLCLSLPLCQTFFSLSLFQLE